MRQATPLLVRPDKVADSLPKDLILLLYIHTKAIPLVAEGGIAPPTSGLWVPRSNWLSYSAARFMQIYFNTKLLKLLVAGPGFEPGTSRLWALRAANCSTPRRDQNLIPVQYSGFCHKNQVKYGTLTALYFDSIVIYRSFDRRTDYGISRKLVWRSSILLGGNYISILPVVVYFHAFLYRLRLV